MAPCSTLLYLFLPILAIFVNWTTAPRVLRTSKVLSGNNSTAAFSSVLYNNHYPEDNVPSSNFPFSQFFEAFRQNLQPQAQAQPQQRPSGTGTSANSDSASNSNPNTNLMQMQDQVPVTDTNTGYEDNRGRRPVPHDYKKPYVLPNPPHLNNPHYLQHYHHDPYAPPPPVLAIANSQRLLPPSMPVVAGPVSIMDDQRGPVLTDLPPRSLEEAGFSRGFAAELRDLAGRDRPGPPGPESTGNDEEQDEEQPAFEVQPEEPEFRNQGSRPPPGPDPSQERNRPPPPVPEPEPPKIPLGPLNVYPDAVTLSGFSSGGAFVQQLLVAHPSMFTGIGIFHQTFYRCGGGGGLVEDFDFLCTQLPSNYTRRRVPYDPQLAINDIESYGAQGLIENPSQLANKRIYIYAGLLNEVFTIEMQMNIIRVLEPYVGDPDQIKTRVQNAQNSLPTAHYGLPCDQPAVNNFLVGNCNLNGAHEALSWLLGLGPAVIHRPTKNDHYNPHSFMQFDQSEFFQGIQGHHHMAELGYIYIPYKCTEHGVTCLLHVYFHGCRTGSDYVGSNHVRNSGYLELAELNNIVMLFPQVARNQINYLGCWDSFGNTGEFYATQKGQQIIIVRRMIERILGLGVGIGPIPINPDAEPPQGFPLGGPGPHAGLGPVSFTVPVHGEPAPPPLNYRANVVNPTHYASVNPGGNPSKLPSHLTVIHDPIAKIVNHDVNLNYANSIPSPNNLNLNPANSNSHGGHAYNYEMNAFSHQPLRPPHNQNQPGQRPRQEHVTGQEYERFCKNKHGLDFAALYQCQAAHEHAQAHAQKFPQEHAVLNYNYDNFLIR